LPHGGGSPRPRPAVLPAGMRLRRALHRIGPSKHRKSGTTLAVGPFEETACSYSYGTLFAKCFYRYVFVLAAAWHEVHCDHNAAWKVVNHR
jgi:hypothetical protein